MILSLTHTHTGTHTLRVSTGLQWSKGSEREAGKRGRTQEAVCQTNPQERRLRECVVQFGRKEGQAEGGKARRTREWKHSKGGKDEMEIYSHYSAKTREGNPGARDGEMGWEDDGRWERVSEETGKVRMLHNVSVILQACQRTQSKCFFHFYFLSK